MKRRYGLLGLLALIGLMGVAAHKTSLYPFLAFALFFEYLFIEPDEMFIENMRKAAAWAFYSNLAITTAVTCILLSQPTDTALLTGIGAGFGASLIVFSFASAWFDWKDRRGVAND